MKEPEKKVRAYQVDFDYATTGTIYIAAKSEEEASEGTKSLLSQNVKNLSITKITPVIQTAEPDSQEATKAIAEWVN